MIEYIRGIIQEKKIDRVIIEVNGLGYSVLVSTNTIAELPSVEGKAILYIFESSSMYGGNVSWYGFLTLEEREIFNMLRGVSKIGSKGAIDILNKISKSLNEFKRAIVSKDIKTLTGYFGFTSKKAEKLILGLKNKIKELKDFDINENNYGNSSDVSSQNDAIGGLIALGYKQSTARSMIKEVLKDNIKEDLSTEDFIKLALKSMLVK